MRMLTKMLTKIRNKNKIKAINYELSTYPCVDYLHNALRFILENETDVAYTEICHAIMRSGADLTETEKEEFYKKNQVRGLRR